MHWPDIGLYRPVLEYPRYVSTFPGSAEPGRIPDYSYPARYRQRRAAREHTDPGTDAGALMTRMRLVFKLEKKII